MECPTCGGQSLTAGDEGMLVCDDCAERFPGFRDEELDDAFVGTAVSNRTSQASQASQIRARLAALEREEKAKRTAPRVSVPDEELVLCDAVLTLTKGIAESMVEGGIFPARIYAPLLQILTHWVRRRHAMVGTRRLGGGRGPKVEPGGYVRRFHVAHILSFVGLAGLCVRSAILPRDLCALVAKGRIPFFDAARRFLTDEMWGVRSVRAVLSPLVVPQAVQVKQGMFLHGCGEFSWPALREFFNGHMQLYEIAAVGSTPLGHLHITLRRVIAYLGLPDAFGARVLRYIDLREQAREALDACEAPRPQKGYRKRNAWDMEGGGAFSWKVGKMHNCSEYPTDRTLQIDIVNTMRICYGKCDGALAKGLECLETWSENDDVWMGDLEEEWGRAVERMQEWVASGGGDDGRLATWGTLSGEAVSNLRGSRLKRFLSFVESTEAENEVPLFMRSHLRAFENISQRPEWRSGEPSSSQRGRRGREVWNWCDRHVRAGRSYGGVGEEIAQCMTNGVEMVDDDTEVERVALLPVVAKGGKGERKGHCVWNEPVEIGIAWSMIRHFFAGPSGGYHLEAASSLNSMEVTNLVETAEKTMRMVLDYINIELGGGIHRKKRLKDEEELVVEKNRTAANVPEAFGDAK